MRLVVAVAAVARLAAAAIDIADIKRESSADIVAGAYIVELEVGTSIKRGFSSPHAELYDDLAKRGALWDVTREFSVDILTGVALTLHSDQDLLKLAQSSGVKAITPVYNHAAPTPVNSYAPTGPTDPALHKDTLSTHVMTGVDKLHDQGYLGQGIKIGIIDTGIDYTHPALGGKFGPGNKVIGGYDFVGDAYRGSSGPAAVPDNDPLDQCNGHGTHIAGIIGANPDNPYNISGVAYQASLNAYRIFGCSGTVSSDIIIAALIRAYRDDNDVITLSLGNPSGWSEGVTGVIASRIADKGKVVTASVGNDGAYGSWYPGSPATGLNVISVGSADNTIVNIQNATTSAGRTIPYYSFLPVPIPSGLPLYATTMNITSVNDACTALPSTTPNLANYVVVIRRGGCAFTTKFANAAAFGGRYFLAYDSANQPLEQIGVGNYTAVLISQQDGIYLVTEAIPAKQTISFPNASYAYPIPTGGLASSFSSFGPTYDLYLKPAITAPGANILSTIPVALGSYLVQSGSSMAAPFVAGSAALLLQARGKTNEMAKSIRSMLENTALPTRVAPSNTSLFETVTHQGAGLVQVYDAVNNLGSMSPAELLLNDTANFKKGHTVTIRNGGRQIVTYRLEHVPAGTANTISGIEPIKYPLSLVPNAASVTIFPSKVTVLPGTSVNVALTFTAPTGLDPKSFPIYSGFIQATGSDGSTLHSTYLGLAASLKSMRIIDTETNYQGARLPLITDKSNKPISTRTRFTMQDTDVPLVVYRLVAGSPSVRLDLIDAHAELATNLKMRRRRGDGDKARVRRTVWDWLFPHEGDSFSNVRTIGVVYEEDYLPRNTPEATAALRGFNTFKVTSFANGTAIPDGSYKILLRALKIGGDAGREEDYEVWTSPEIDIWRP